MISAVFIHRPRLAFVISIVLTIAGVVAMFTLPISLYPEIVPPQVQISSTYTGSSADVVRDTVVVPIENQVNGVEDMIYMSSTAANDGSANTIVTFKPNTAGEMDTVLTQNRVSFAMGHLPSDVTRAGIIVKQKSADILLLVNLVSPDHTYDGMFLSNYLSINIMNEILRLDGVADAVVIGALDYAMRIWVDPDRLAGHNLTADDVVAAINQQNLQAAAGQIGMPPAQKGQKTQFMIQVKGRLENPEEFAQIVVRSDPDGSMIRIKDIGRVELGSFNYNSTTHVNGKAGAVLAVYQLPKANGIQIADDIHKKMKELSRYFPPDMAYDISFDTTLFVRKATREVVMTLFIAVALVILVVFVFLQDWRSVLIPTIAVPVSLIGTFAVLYALGYNINLVSLFGLILAIGIVVDDAIIIVENVHRLMDEEGLDPVRATEKTMEQVTGPVVATTLVLLAMFVPVCFLPGITGALYRQFAVTISVSVLISCVNALSLSPALCASLLVRRHGKPPLPFRAFNALFAAATKGYVGVAGLVARHAILGLMLLSAACYGCWCLYGRLPAGFIPGEDMGEFYVSIQLPDGAALERTTEAAARAGKIIGGLDGVETVINVSGYDKIDGIMASNYAMLAVVLKDWDLRKDPSQSQKGIMMRAQRLLDGIPEASFFIFPRPSIPGCGAVGGVSYVLEDMRNLTPALFAQSLSALIIKMNDQPEIARAYSTYRANVPQLFVDIDREKLYKLGVNLKDVFSAMQEYLGAFYINDFNKFGQVFRVMIQADTPFRGSLKGLLGLYVKNKQGQMVPLETLVSARTVFGPQVINRYNMYQAAIVNATHTPGYSTGQVMDAMARVSAATLPEGFKFEWTDMSYQEKLASGKTWIVFVLALTFIYLFLVGQYESWMIPAAVILSVPVAFIGSLSMLCLLKVENNIYTQVGFVLLFGMACKTAILMVDFAKERRAEGLGVVESALAAGRIRFRAVVMTAFAFILGVMPLVVAQGAGAASRRALGTAVFGGMLAAGLLGTVMVPSFYVIIQKLREKLHPHH